MADQADRTPLAEPVLRVAQASVGYRGVPVLSEVDCTVRAGEAMALIGPNGAGKSTLIKAVLGLAEVTAGSVTVLGQPPARMRGRAAYVPQVDTLDADFPVSVGQVVLMGRYRDVGWLRPIRRTDREIAAEALDRVGLADRRATRFGLLSGGQRQRVLLARAIAARSPLMLLDEPFNGVDAVSQEAILRVLRELTAAGSAVMLSTHDLAVARQVCNTVCLINGRQFGFGPTGQTLTSSMLRYSYGSQAVELHGDRMVLVQP